jgi:hypothetical protein
MDYEYEFLISEFEAELLLIRLYLSFISNNLLAALGSLSHALCYFAKLSSWLLPDFFLYIACSNSFCDLSDQIYLLSYNGHIASRSLIIGFEFL